MSLGQAGSVVMITLPMLVSPVTAGQDTERDFTVYPIDLFPESPCSVPIYRHSLSKFRGNRSGYSMHALPLFS